MTPVLTLAAYTHFGASALRGVVMYHLVHEVWRRGGLRRVIAVSRRRCRYDFDARLISTLPGESRLVSGLSRVSRRVWKGFPARLVSEAIFDRYAASRLPATPGVLVAMPRMVSTTRRARALGYRTVLYGGVPHPVYLAGHIRAERVALELRDEPRGRSRMLARLTAQLEASDYVLTVSEFSKATYVQHGVPADRVLVAPTGVDLTRFPLTPPPSAREITYVYVAHVNGTIALVKGLQYLLEAWAQLALPDAKLVVCGKIDGEGREIVRRYAPRIANVRFTGPVSNVADHYRDADVFVLPSLADGMAKVTLEAMATGRPVVVTPNSGAVARDGVDGFFVPPRDVEALKARLLHFHRHRGDVATMGASAAARAREFGWMRFSRQVADIVEDLAAGVGRTPARAVGVR